MGARRGKIIINPEVCKGCKLCIDFCPQSCIETSDQLNTKGYFPVRFRTDCDACTGCAVCAVMCPDVAIEVYRE